MLYKLCGVVGMPETLRLWAEMSGIKILDSRPHRDGWIVNGKFYVYQEGGNVVAERFGAK